MIEIVVSRSFYWWVSFITGCGAIQHWFCPMNNLSKIRFNYCISFFYVLCLVFLFKIARIRFSWWQNRSRFHSLKYCVRWCRWWLISSVSCHQSLLVKSAVIMSLYTAAHLTSTTELYMCYTCVFRHSVCHNGVWLYYTD